VRNLPWTCTSQGRQTAAGLIVPVSSWFRGNVVGWGTMLQGGKSQVRFPMRSLDFLIDLILPAAQWALGSTQPLTEMSTRNLPGGKGLPARKADLTAFSEPIIYKMWEPRRFTTLWTSTACYRDRFNLYLHGSHLTSSSKVLGESDTTVIVFLWENPKEKLILCVVTMPWRCVETALHIIGFKTWWTWAVSFTLRPYYPWGKDSSLPVE
jgi:hypothetical protein